MTTVEPAVQSTHESGVLGGGGKKRERKTEPALKGIWWTQHKPPAQNIRSKSAACKVNDLWDHRRSDAEQLKQVERGVGCNVSDASSKMNTEQKVKSFKSTHVYSHGRIPPQRSSPPSETSQNFPVKYSQSRFSFT